MLAIKITRSQDVQIEPGRSRSTVVYEHTLSLVVQKFSHFKDSVSTAAGITQAVGVYPAIPTACVFHSEHPLPRNDEHCYRAKIYSTSHPPILSSSLIWISDPFEVPRVDPRMPGRNDKEFIISVVALIAFSMAWPKEQASDG